MTYRLPYPITRRKTREVKVGGLTIGGNNPVVVQSMVNTDTMDTEATIAQCISLAEQGCQMVRITASDEKSAKNLFWIKDGLLKRGYDIPLVADIHFNPRAAEIAASCVEKIRINPGNYVDRKWDENCSDKDYEDILSRAMDNISPLIDICKQYHTAIRIGTNHGSLSERIVHRYGNTPEAMAQSAMEYLRIFEKMDFHNIVLSMKASTVRVMNYANRLLVSMMDKENMDYPIHLGVTEAGNGTDGRIKSICGIGSLLSLGIGDTIRVSLTEKPENEIPVAREIVRAFSSVPYEAEAKQPLDIHLDYEKHFLKWKDNEAKTVNLSHCDIGEVLINAPKEQRPLILTCDREDLEGEKQTLISSLASTVLMEGYAKDVLLPDEGLSRDILQATGDRYYKAEFVACPSCGRTKYDIQAALEKVKQACSHLTGVKIAVMGCIVNGPGEITDADYGYIGCGSGKVNLYRGRTPVHTYIDESQAINLLIAMIKEDNRWKEKE